MPLVRLEVRQGRSATQKQALLDAAHAALVRPWISRTMTGCSASWSTPAITSSCHPGSSDNFVLVEVTMFAGRSRQAKRQLYQALVRNFGELGVAPTDVFVYCRSRPWTTGVSAEAGWPARWTWVSRSKSDQPHHAPAR